MRHTTKSCPYCRYAYVRNKIGPRFYWGSPIVVCENCGRGFIDKDGHEMAAEYSSVEKAKLMLGIKSALINIPYIIMGGVILYGTIGSLNAGVALIGIIIGGFLVYGGIRGALACFKMESNSFVEEEYAESLKRLNDPQFAVSYKNLPRLAKYYRKRINESGLGSTQKTVFSDAQRENNGSDKKQDEQPSTLQPTIPASALQTKVFPQDIPLDSKQTHRTGDIYKRATVKEYEAEDTSDSAISFCRYCGSRLLDGAPFCRKCGRRVFEGVTESDITEKKEDDAEELVIQKDKEEKVPAAVKIELNELPPKLQRAFLFLEDGEWERADRYLEAYLDEDPMNAYAYLGKAMLELKIKTPETLAENAEALKDNKSYAKAVRFADEGLKNRLML